MDIHDFLFVIGKYIEIKTMVKAKAATEDKSMMQLFKSLDIIQMAVFGLVGILFVVLRIRSFIQDPLLILIFLAFIFGIAFFRQVYLGYKEYRRNKDQIIGHFVKLSSELEKPSERLAIAYR